MFYILLIVTVDLWDLNKTYIISGRALTEFVYLRIETGDELL